MHGSRWATLSIVVAAFGSFIALLVLSRFYLWPAWLFLVLLCVGITYHAHSEAKRQRLNRASFLYYLSENPDLRIYDKVSAILLIVGGGLLGACAILFCLKTAIGIEASITSQERFEVAFGVGAFSVMTGAILNQWLFRRFWIGRNRTG